MDQEIRWVVYVFENGCFVDEQKDDLEFLPELGDWTAPFPNEPGNSTAFGMAESFWQSDRYPDHEAWGELVRVVVSRTKPLLVFAGVVTS